jgi:hypothetical protein
MRTTIELKDESRAKLLEMAARRGEKGFSTIIDEALDLYLRAAEAGEGRRRAALALRGRLGAGAADRLRSVASALRGAWR